MLSFKRQETNILRNRTPWTDPRGDSYSYRIIIPALERHISGNLGSKPDSAFCQVCDLGRLSVNQSPLLEKEDPESIHSGLSPFPLAHSTPASMAACSHLRAFAPAVPSA